jgi:hypothetical protein
VTFYLGTFNAHLAARGVEPLSRESFEVQFELALVDYARMLFSYMLKDATPQSVKAAANDFNRGLYTRRMECLVWLVTRTRAAVESLETRGRI